MLDKEYRPANFDEVIGQEPVVKSLKELLKSGKIPHCFLFVGGSGQGKTTISRILSKELGCGETGLIEVDAATNGGVDEMRELTEAMRHRAMGSPVRVAIIDEAHAMSKIAWTAMLKSIEDAPVHAYYMFCTTELGKIPKTILTRCHTYELQPVSTRVLRDYLTVVAELEGFTLSEDIIKLAADESGGSPRQALVYLSQVRGCSSVEEARELLVKTDSEGETYTIELARLMVAGEKNFDQYQMILNGLPDSELDAARFILCKYVNKCVLNARNQNEAKRLMVVLDAVDQIPLSLNTKDEKRTALLLAVGRIIMN